MALTVEERARTRYHLGFPNVGNQTILALGVPAAGHPAFLLEATMNNILPEAEPTFRAVLKQCDCIEAQLADARSRIKAQTAGNVVLRGREELEDLEDQYDYWTDALVDIFGVNKNPFSKKHQRVGGEYVVINPS
ncbi:MAG: hypothetical protein CL819_01310 [Croceicoccus sp.]|nr:hypothetical protein [Croceicoccus sp.]